jgi:hypothetical protein
VVDPELDYVITLSRKFTGPNDNNNLYGPQLGKSKDIALAEIKVFNLNTA